MNFYCYSKRQIPICRDEGISVCRSSEDGAYQKRKHGSDVERRLEADSDCGLEWIKSQNRSFIEGFRKSEEKIILIDDDYSLVLDGV